MLEVEKVRPVEVRWHVMSLSVLNEGSDVSAAYAERMRKAWGPVRVVIAAQQQYGEDVVGRLYTEMGTRIHPQGMEIEDAVVESVHALNLDGSLLTAATSTDFDEALRASHSAGINLVGQDVGTPVIAVPGPDGESQVAFFGPVVTPAPRGEQAGRLWDGTLLVAATPGFYEIKRTRTMAPDFG